MADRYPVGADLAPRREHDFYPTPEGLVRGFYDIKQDVFNHYNKVGLPVNVLYPGFGTGVWGKQFMERVPTAQIFGVDIRSVPDPGWYFTQTGKDFLAPTPLIDVREYNFVIGNPPYKYAEEFIRKSYDRLKLFGSMYMLLRVDFLSSRKRGNGLWKEIPPTEVFILSRRPSFSGDKKTDAYNYMIVVWKKESIFRTIPLLYWLDWEYE